MVKVNVRNHMWNVLTDTSLPPHTKLFCIIDWMTDAERFYTARAISDNGVYSRFVYEAKKLQLCEGYSYAEAVDEILCQVLLAIGQVPE